MKEGWEYKSLGEVCNIDFGTRVVRSRDAGSIYPVYGGGGATFKMDMYNREDCMVISRFGMSEQCTRFVKGKFFLNDSGLTLSMKENCMIQEFMDWQILYLNNTIYSLGRGAAQKNLDTKALAEVRITYPNNLSEQQSIVDYLDSAFAKIDAMKANAEKALNEAKALFQASLKEMLEPKEGWEEKTLGNIAEDSADGPFGSNLKKEHYTTKKEVRIIQLSNIGEDGWREENTKYTTFEHLKNISRSEVEPNDIVIAKMMPAGRAILCPSHEAKFVLSSDAVKIKLKKGMLTRFILHSINSPYFRNEVYENVTGSGRVRTSLTKLRACSVYLPSLEVQQTIVDTLDSIKSKVNRLQENYDKISQECDALKQAILRQVFE